MRTWDTVALWLLIIGALNWLLVGLFGFDLVAALLGPLTFVSRLVYVVVGVAGVYYMVALLSPARRAARTT